MLLQLHAKDQKNSIIWFSIKLEKFHFGPLLTSKKKKKNLKNHLIQFYVFMLLNLHAKKSKTLRPLILDKNWTLHFGPISDPFWPQTAKIRLFKSVIFLFMKHETLHSRPILALSGLKTTKNLFVPISPENPWTRFFLFIKSGFMIVKLHDSLTLCKKLEHLKEWF